MAIAAWFVLLIFFCFYWGQKLLASAKADFSSYRFIGTLIIPLLMAFAIYEASLVGVLVIVAFEILLGFLVSVAKEKEVGENFSIMLIAFAVSAGLSVGAYFLVQALR